MKLVGRYGLTVRSPDTLGGLVLDEALSHRRRTRYRDHFARRRGAYNFFGQDRTTSTDEGKSAAMNMAVLKRTRVCARPSSTSRDMLNRPFGFQNQPPLPRRLAPNAFVGVCVQESPCSEAAGVSPHARGDLWVVRSGG